ncbi:MAG TPA: hypothetical protein PKY10_05955, partial [Lentisphaeria bacterium]|nr:hypothetical protein [Lentisphaeria bacterium]
CGGMTQEEMIREQDVIDVFGLASGQELREMAAGLFTNDLNRAMRVLHVLADGGRDLERLFGDLIGYVRNVMVAAMCSDAQSFLEVSETDLADLMNIGRSLDPQLAQRILQGLVAQEWSFRSALNKRIYFEAILARVMLDAHSVQLDDIFTHLNRLGGILPEDAMPAPRPVIVIPTQTDAATTTTPDRDEPPLAPAPPPSAPPPKPKTPAPATPTPTAPVTPPPPAAPDPAPTPPATPAAPATPPPPAAPDPTPDAPTPKVILTTANVHDFLTRASQNDDGGAEWSDDDGAGDPGATQDLSSTVSMKLNSIVENLSQAIAVAGHDSLAAIIRTMTLVSFPQETMIITLGYDMNALPVNDLMIIQRQDSQQTLQNVARQQWPNATLKIVAKEPLPEENTPGRYRIATSEEQKLLAENPFVQRVNQLFDAVVIEARIKI